MAVESINAGLAPARKVWPAPAKLNLFLHILGRRADGYHELQTVFQLLDYGDSLYFTPRRDKCIQRLYQLPGVAAEQDLIVRAALLLQAHTGTDIGVDIGLVKRIPQGSGLGGGSSDAATVLVALNALWKTGLDVEALAQLGLSLGADVPVFVRGYSAWAEGIGERATPITLPPRWYLVLTPPVFIRTATVFAAPELTRNTAPIRIPDFLCGHGHNDCEAWVRKHYAEVDAAARWLARFGKVRMTGTGSALFVAFAERDAAQIARQQVPPQWQAFVACGINRSPLFAKAMLIYCMDGINQLA